MQIRQVEEALAQVRRLRSAVGDGIRFRGYSGTARVVSGLFVAAGAARLAGMPKADLATVLTVWSLVMVLAATVNAAALIRWVLVECEGDWRALSPVRLVVLPLIVGGLLTAGLVLRGSADLIYGTWMCMYGLANVASRRVLPREIGAVGSFYIILGGLCLLLPGVTVATVWTMAVVFGIGETAAGAILVRDQRRFRQISGRRMVQ